MSVIIPVFNAERTLVACLAALSQQSYQREYYEIIVVDDQSTDETQAVVRSFPKVRLLVQPHQGPAAARNMGAEHARGEVLLFTDSDCVPARDWIEQMTLPFGNSDIVGVKGVYTSDQSEPVARFVQLEYEDKYDRISKYQFIDFIDTYSAGYRRDTFLSNGGFNRVFPISSVEDQEFSFRLARQGHKLIFKPTARVNHLAHASNLKTYWQKKFRIGYWKVVVHKRHPDKLLHDTHTPQVLKMQILLVGSGGILLLGSFIQPIWGWLTLIVWSCFLFTTLPFCFKAWRKDQRVALVAPWLLLVRATALGLGFALGLVDTLLKRNFAKT